jgi:hypothetical protein
MLLAFPLVSKIVFATSSIGSSEMTLYAVADAYVDSSSPSVNYGNESRLYVASNSEEEHAYVLFDLSRVPSEANILSARIRLYLQDTHGQIYWSPADSIGVHYCSDDSWNELEITYDNKPTFNSTPSDRYFFSIVYTLEDYKSWDATQDLKTALPTGKLVEVLKFESKTTDRLISAEFDSREGTNKPRLEIEYSMKEVCNIHLESALDTGESVNLGSMRIVGVTFSLPSDVSVVVGSYNVNYDNGYDFVGWVTSGGVRVSDPNARNTTVTVSENGTLKAVGGAKRIEYAYDIGNRSTWASQDSGCMYAVRFTPVRSGQLMTVRFYIYASQWTTDSVVHSNNTFKVHIMNGDRNDIIPPLSQTPALMIDWFSVDLTDYGINVTSDVDFHVGIEWILDNHPDIGTFQPSWLGHSTGRSWRWNGTTWTEQRIDDFMIRAVVGTVADHRITNGFTFQVCTESNSTISDFQFNETEKKIFFNVDGPSGTIGFCNVTIPKQLLRGDFNVMLDGENAADFVQSSNETHTSLHLTYDHSRHQVEIIGTIAIPESATFLSTLLMAIVLSAVIIRKKASHRLRITDRFT